MKFNEIFLTTFILVVSTALIMFMTYSDADTKTAASNATIAEYVAIGISNNLSLSGISFGTIQPNTGFNNATGNNETLSSNSSYIVNVSTDSNVNVDFCIKDSYALNHTSNLYQIGNGNYTWKDNNASTQNPSSPFVPGTQMLTTYQRTNFTNLNPGGAGAFRFWLNVSAGQQAGVYSNSVLFEGIKTGNAC